MKHIHNAVGIKYLPKTYLIEIGAISAFNKSIIFNDKNHAKKKEYDTSLITKVATPPTFSRFLNPGEFETEIDNPYSNRLDGGSEWHYFKDITHGDIMTISGEISRVKIKNGSLGDMCIVTSNFDYVNQKNELSCTQISTIIYYNFSINHKINLTPHTTKIKQKPHEIPTTINIGYLNIGDALPELIKQPSTQQLVMYAGASRDFYQIHYDQQFAQAIGLPTVIVHGALKSAFLGQMLTNFINESANLTRLLVRYNSIDFEGCVMKCKGTITNIHTTDSKKIIDCDVWIENSDGIKTTKGTATFKLN